MYFTPSSSSYLFFFIFAHAATSFVDRVPAWAKGAVEYLVEKGAIHGYPDGTFKPSNVITRAEQQPFLLNL